MIYFKTRMEENDILSKIGHKMSLSYSYKYSSFASVLLLFTMG